MLPDIRMASRTSFLSSLVLSSNSIDSEWERSGPGEGEGDGDGEGKYLEMPEVSASMIVERSVGGAIERWLISSRPISPGGKKGDGIGDGSESASVAGDSSRDAY